MCTLLTRSRLLPALFPRACLVLVSVYLIPFRFALLRSARSCHLGLPPPHLHALAERRILLGLTPYSYERETSEDSSSPVVGPFHLLTPSRALESLAVQVTDGDRVLRCTVSSLQLLQLSYSKPYAIQFSFRSHHPAIYLGRCRISRTHFHV